MTDIKVTVIIPCFNNGVLLTEMIGCISRQTITNWELIVVDDQSTDSSPNIVKEFEKNDKRIKLIVRNREPKGSATCRNIGFENAQGEYIMHLDADDLISDTCLEHRVKFLNQNLDIDYASFPAKSFVNSRNKEEFILGDGTWGMGTNKDLLSCFLTVNYPFSGWTNIYRKKSIVKLPWDENVKIYTDFSFIVPCILHGLKHKFSNTSNFDYYYRINYGSNNMCTSFVKPEKNKSTIYLFNKTLNSLSSKSDYKKRKKEFLQFVILHFERLVFDGKRKDLNIFLDFIYKQYHSQYILFYIVSKSTNTIKNKKFKRLIFLLLMIVLLGNKKHFIAIKNQIKL